MLGAIIGDIVGSRFEWDNYKARHILMPVMVERFPAGFISATRSLITAMATVRQCA